MPSSPTISPSGVWNVRSSARARRSRTLAALRASGQATVRCERRGQLGGFHGIEGRKLGCESALLGPTTVYTCELKGRTGIVQRLARLLVPQERRLSLRRDSDALELAQLVPLVLELLETLLDAAVNLARVDGRVVLVPAGLGVHCGVERKARKAHASRGRCQEGQLWVYRGT